LNAVNFWLRIVDFGYGRGAEILLAANKLCGNVTEAGKFRSGVSKLYHWLIWCGLPLIFLSLYDDRNNLQIGFCSYEL
jgi:hypothetical protein